MNDSLYTPHAIVKSIAANKSPSYWYICQDAAGMKPHQDNSDEFGSYKFDYAMETPLNGTLHITYNFNAEPDVRIEQALFQLDHSYEIVTLVGQNNVCLSQKDLNLLLKCVEAAIRADYISYVLQYLMYHNWRKTKEGPGVESKATQVLDCAYNSRATVNDIRKAYYTAFLT